MPAKKELLVIKFGTTSITHNNGTPNFHSIQRIAREVSTLLPSYRLVLVSSGAVGAGKFAIKNYAGSLAQKKAAAAVGNLALISSYGEAFKPYQHNVAQCLIEKGHFSNRRKFLELKDTFEELWRNDIIPIANENDVVNSRQLKFSDNDELATLIAMGFGAKKLMLCTLSGGLLDKQKQVIKEISDIDSAVFSLVDDSLSSSGLGGMASKLTFTKMATTAGVDVSIFGLSHDKGILSALQKTSGSHFQGKEVKISNRKKWLLSSTITTAKIHIDTGAEMALKDRKSLLSVGVIEIQGIFQKGEFIEILTRSKEAFAVARSKINSKDITKDGTIVIAHADDIVLF